jgi:hypothetical protein
MIFVPGSAESSPSPNLCGRCFLLYGSATGVVLIYYSQEDIRVVINVMLLCAFGDRLVRLHRP